MLELENKKFNKNNDEKLRNHIFFISFTSTLILIRHNTKNETFDFWSSRYTLTLKKRKYIAIKC